MRPSKMTFTAEMRCGALGMEVLVTVSDARDCDASTTRTCTLAKSILHVAFSQSLTSIQAFLPQLDVLASWLDIT